MSNGSNPVLGGGGIHHAALKSCDFDASVAFYTDILGFQPVMQWGEDDGRAIMLDTGDGACIEIFAGGATTATDGKPILHVALNCDDVDGVTEKVRAAGMEITREPATVEIPSTRPVTVRLAFFKGPDGEIVELLRTLDQGFS